MSHAVYGKNTPSLKKYSTFVIKLRMIVFSYLIKMSEPMCSTNNV